MSKRRGYRMSKRICGLLVILGLLCGILLPITTTYAAAQRGFNSMGTTVANDGGITAGIIVQWQYTPSLEGAKVNINLFQNGKLLRTIAENVSIGKNGHGEWTWNKSDMPAWGKGFQIEIVCQLDNKVRVMGNNLDDWEAFGRVNPGEANGFNPQPEPPGKVTH